MVEMTTTGPPADSVETVTVMFTDLVDSTPRRVRLGEDEAERLRERHDQLVRAGVLNHRGRIVKHTGDGVMATFAGAADAIAAAVGIQQEMDADNRRRQAGSADEELEVRIGISAGDVRLVGDDCFGLPVIEAQRLESVARPGQILVSSLVSALARGRGGHELRLIGNLELKGLEAPVEVQEVTWVRVVPEAAALPPALVERGGLPFAGRAKAVDGPLAPRPGRRWASTGWSGCSARHPWTQPDGPTPCRVSSLWLWPSPVAPTRRWP